MPDSKHGPLDEPGKRSGTGAWSILPHLQRQVQTQIKPPAKKQSGDTKEGPESVPPKEQGS